MNTINAGQAVSQQLLQILTKASLENLNAGDILQGRVQALDNGMLLLKLLDGAFFTAKVPDGFSASFGDLITLEIGEKQNDQLTAKIIPPTDPQKQPVKNADQPLANEVLQKLISLGTSQPEKLVGQALDIIKANPGLPAEQAAFAAANKMVLSPETIKLIQRISEHEFQLHDHLVNLKDGLSLALEKMDTSVRQALLKPVLITQELDDLALNLKQILSNAPINIKEPIAKNIREVLTKTLLNEMTQNNAAPDTPRLLDPKSFDRLLSKALHNTKIDNPGNKTEPELPLIKPEVANKLLESINKALEDIHTRSKAIGKSGVKDSSEILEKLFDKAFVGAEDGTVERLDLKDKAKVLKEIMDFSQKALNQTDGKVQEVNLQAFKEIDGAFRFYSQVSTYDSVIQLPIRINKENTSGELFVMKRKNGRKKLDPDNFTLLLSLQTSALGRIESFLNSSRKCVTISFRVEQEELVKLVKDNHRVLYDALMKKGYKLAEMKCRVLENENETAGLLDASIKAQELLGLKTSLDLKI